MPSSSRDSIDKHSDSSSDYDEYGAKLLSSANTKDEKVGVERDRYNSLPKIFKGAMKPVISTGGDDGVDKPAGQLTCSNFAHIAKLNTSHVISESDQRNSA